MLYDANLSTVSEGYGSFGECFPTANHDRADIDVIPGLCWSVDDDGTYNAAGILSRVMSVIPCGPEKVGDEFVRETLAWGNRALRDTWGSIFPWCPYL